MLFIPLSPKSSRTMEKHKKEHEAALARGEVSGDEEDERGRRDEGHRHLERGASGAAAGRSRTNGDSVLDSDVEDIPDRFDRQGHSLDPNSPERQSGDRWTTRSGDFERRPQGRGDMDARGSWQVGGTDPEAVERIVKGVTGALGGKGGWMEVVGSVLGSGLLGGPAADGQVEGGRGDDDGRGQDEKENRGRHRRR